MGVDIYTDIYYVVVDGVHQKDLPRAGTVIDTPDVSQTKQSKVYNDSTRYAFINLAQSFYPLLN